MKMSVNVEATDEEIRDLASDVARRGLVYLIQIASDSLGSLGRNFTPEAAQSMFAGLSAGAGPFIAHIAQAQKQAQKNSMNHGRVPPFAAGYGPTPIRTVVPFPGSDAVMERCQQLEETKQNEAAWLCHVCASANGMMRSRCRTCDHARCGIPVVTPPSTGPGPNPVEPEPA